MTQGYQIPKYLLGVQRCDGQPKSFDKVPVDSDKSANPARTQEISRTTHQHLHACPKENTIVVILSPFVCVEAFVVGRDRDGHSGKELQNAHHCHFNLVCLVQMSSDKRAQITAN